MAANDEKTERGTVGRVFDPPSKALREEKGGSETRPTAILFILSGSIACYKACDAISQLVQRGHRVQVVATAAALRFVGTATLEGLTRQKVATDLFAEGGALDHIALAREADAIVVCPATANTINRTAAGIADDLAGALLLAHDWKKPLLVVPAMNPAMWQHPATRAAVERLKSWGARFVNAGVGRTACGESGEGRLAEPDEIVAAIETALASPARRLRVLVTSGGTAEPIDRVRAITNLSTGATGAAIAEHFARVGHDVVLLRARAAVRPDAAVREETFHTFADLAGALERRLATEEFDTVIHAAAVSDFAVETIEADGISVLPGAMKIESESPPTLRLRRNPKLLERLRSWSRYRDVKVVAFKLTGGADAAEARRAIARLFDGGVTDLVVHNDLAARGTDGRFPATIWGRGGEIAAACADRRDIGPALERLLVGSADAPGAAAGMADGTSALS